MKEFLFHSMLKVEAEPAEIQNFKVQRGVASRKNENASCVGPSMGKSHWLNLQWISLSHPTVLLLKGEKKARPLRLTEVKALLLKQERKL